MAYVSILSDAYQTNTLIRKAIETLWKIGFSSVQRTPEQQEYLFGVSNNRRNFSKTTPSIQFRWMLSWSGGGEQKSHNRLFCLAGKNWKFWSVDSLVAKKQKQNLKGRKILEVRKILYSRWHWHTKASTFNNFRSSRCIEIYSSVHVALNLATCLEVKKENNFAKMQIAILDTFRLLYSVKNTI